MSAIFISHSSRDGDAAAELRQRLADAGHRSVFLDFDPEDGIPAGRSWEQELYARLRACRAVVVLCSEHSMASDWVFAEITHARALGKHVLPIKVGRCEVRSLLTDVQVIDLAEGREAGYERLRRGLELAGLDPRGQFDWDGSRPPYPGLLAFQAEDAAIFFGREQEIGEGLGLLNRRRSFGGSGWLLTLGASGSGKSSLVRAGIVPRLRRDREAWRIVGPFRPLDRPFDELADAFARAFAEAGAPRDPATIATALGAAPSSAGAAALVELARELLRAAEAPRAGVLLLVDQFEEVLTAPGDAASGRLLTLLAAALDTAGTPLTVLATLRSDYLGDFQAHPALRGVELESLAVGPLTPEGMARVIEGPAETSGLELEPGLVRAMIADSETDDALPLVAFTLRELWEGYGESGRLRLANYRELGGLGGSVARAAEMALGGRELEAGQEADLRTAFLALVRIDEEGQFARQPARWSRLPERSHGILERFVAARLLVARGDGEARRLEVAHEALLRVWDRLVGWLEEDRAFLLFRKRLRESYRTWEDVGRRAGYLLRGPALGEAAGWLADRRQALARGERDFIAAGVRAERRRRYRFVALLAAVAVALALFGLRAESQRRRAEQTILSATDVSKLSAARRFRQVAMTMPFAAGPLLDRASTLLTEIDYPMLLVDSIDVEADLAAIAGMSPDLMAIALRREGGLVVYSVLDRRWAVPLPHPAPVYAGLIEGVPPLPLGGFGPARGRHVLTAATDGVVRLWLLPELQPLIEAMMARPDRAKVDALLEALGRRGFEAELLVEFSGHDGPVSRAVIGPSGRFAATAAGSEVALWRTDARAEPPLLGGHSGAVTWVAFSPDGRRLVTASEDRRALLWLLSDPLAAPLELTGHRSQLVAAAFSSDSRQVVTVAADREVRRWSAETGEGEPVAAVDCAPVALQYGAARATAAVGCADGTARVVELEAGTSRIFR